MTRCIFQGLLNMVLVSKVVNRSKNVWGSATPDEKRARHYSVPWLETPGITVWNLSCLSDVKRLPKGF